MALESQSWRTFPPIEVTAPVMALLATGDGLYAGGLGGVTHYTPEEGWRPLLGGLPLRAVTTLAQTGSVLLAGGDGGVALSADGGQSWRSGTTPTGTATVAAIAVSAVHGEGGTILAGTIGSGILRSTDNGQSWESANFGLGSHEVPALTWTTGEAFLAATAAGLFRSPNGGRAWRAIPATAGRVFVALTLTPEGTIIAVPEIGPPWVSAGELTDWEPLGDIGDDTQASAVIALADGALLLGTANRGLLRSVDEGSTWAEAVPSSVLCFAVDEPHLYAGSETGVLTSEDSGQRWNDLPTPPLHDLRQLQIVHGTPLVSGSGSQPMRFVESQGWRACPETPLPLLGLFLAPDGTLFASSPDGLFLSRDGCQTWLEVITGREGTTWQMTFDSNGRIWAALTGDGALLRSRDGGSSWERLPSPFGVLPLIALQLIPGAIGQGDELVAVTYDERQQAAAIWRSQDGGAEWSRGSNIPTPWPVAIGSHTPPLLTVGNAITVRQVDGTWRQTALADRGVRQVTSNSRVILALGTAALWRSDDGGITWGQDDLGLPIDQVLDIALDGETLYALMSGGRLWSRQL